MLSWPQISPPSRKLVLTCRRSPAVWCSTTGLGRTLYIRAGVLDIQIILRTTVRSNTQPKRKLKLLAKQLGAVRNRHSAFLSRREAVSAASLLQKDN